jgi:signal transduction histidine kinase
MREENLESSQQASIASLDDDFVLSVHPSVIFKLGEDLITNDVQALIELVKNAYDADSPSVLVRIQPDVWTEARSGAELDYEAVSRLIAARRQLSERIETLAAENTEGETADSLLREIETTKQELLSTPEPIRGRIIVADRGTGMTLTDIRDGWLTVSASRKRGMKARGEKTAERHRTPLGDKGLGRLGAQRLGRTLTMTTQHRAVVTEGLDRQESAESKKAPILRASIFWDDFESAANLNDVHIEVEEVETRFAGGTTLEIRGIHDPDVWLRTDAFALEGQLVTMISPYSAERGFDVRLNINDQPIDLRELSQAVLDQASIRYSLDYAQGALSIFGRMSIDYLKNTQSQADVAIWERLVGVDNGFAFANWLLESQPGKCRDFGVDLGDDKHFVFINTQIVLDELPGVEREARSNDVDPGPARAVDPGPFSAAVDFVPLRQNPTEVFSGLTEYRSFVRAMNGIRAYRDGFGVPVSGDWLELAGQWSSGKSWYTLRPENVIGHVDFSAEFNSAIEETTDREAFKDSPAYRNFRTLMSVWLRSTEDAQSLVRVGYNKYKSQQIQEGEGLGPNASPQDLARQVEAQFENMGSVATNVADARQAMNKSREAVAALNSQHKTLSEQLFVDPQVLEVNAKAVSEATEAFARIEDALKEIEGIATLVRDRRASLNLLVEQMEDTQSQIRDVWELVSLGITAESVAHEVLNITGRLRARSAQISKYISAHYEDDRLDTYVEHVKAAARSLAQQVSHLDSSLRYVRDRREKVSVASLIEETADYFRARLAGTPLAIDVVIHRDFSARVSRGKISQVLDNLFLNSQFWLEEQIAQGRAAAGRITVRIESPFIVISDSGPGIEVGVEHVLFDPFVTRKPNNQGRGLGLFVVRQLLDSEGVTIELGTNRNESGRLFEFVLDFSASIG